MRSGRIKQKGRRINWLTTKRKVKKDAVSEKVEENVHIVFFTFSVNRPTGRKMNKCRKRLRTENAQMKAYLEFKQGNQEIKTRKEVLSR